MLPEKADAQAYPLGLCPNTWKWTGEHESWMFNRLHAEGIAIAGIDVGDLLGVPQVRFIRSFIPS